MARRQHRATGQPKGRPPGLPNLDRRKFFEELRERMYMKHNITDYDPVIAMADLAEETDDDNIRAHCLANVAKFVRPTLKSVEVTADAATQEELERRITMLGKLDEAIDKIVSEKLADSKGKKD